MSSRAAASRKRLVHSESRPPPSTKGFFSRSKTSATNPTPFDLTEEDAVPHTPTFTTSSTTNNRDYGSQAPSPYHANFYTKRDPFPGERSYAPTYSQSSITPQAMRKAASGPIIPSSAYPSPPFDADDHLQHQIIRLNARSPRGNIPDEYESTFIEASYQPPPPIQASYQPPPPTHSLQVNGQHNAPRSAGKYIPPSQEFDPVPSFPAPPNYPPPVPSTPSANPHFGLPSAQHPLLLRRSSPTLTELPTYSSVHETPFPTPARANRIPIEVSINNSPRPHHGRSEYPHHYDPTSYRSSSPAPRPQRLTPSPFQTHDISPVQSAASLTIENDFRRPMYRGGSSNGTSSPSSSPFLSTYQVPAATSRPPASLSGSSDSGNSDNNKSPSSSNGPSSAVAPAFVFPGSRSIARPKTAPKSSSVFKIKGSSKSRVRQNSDASSNTPPPTPSSSAGASDNRPPSVGVSGTAARSPDPRTVAQKQPNSFSETASAFSDDSSGRSSTNVVSGTWTPASATAAVPADAANEPPKMIYPGGRSRAKPKNAPIIKPKKPKRPASSKSSSTSEEREEKSRFMGLLKRKKQPKSDSSPRSSAVSHILNFKTDSSPTELRSSMAPTEEPLQNYEEPLSMDMAHQESINRAQRAKSRIGSYPLDPYDSVLLDNDRHTGELLVRLNPTGSPSSHNYGNTPPVSVLDLGCGQGHWVVDAAIAWRGYGTKVTGYDMVDISKGLLPWAVEQGVTDNIRFVRGNFLKQRLPFSDGSFDLVRMSCLALCITSDSWVFLLQEVCRVLMIGGRLELIDDLVFFPYGKSSSVFDLAAPSPANSIPPKLDISIPSSSFSTFSIYDEDVTNPGLGVSKSGEDQVDEEDFFDLYEVEEELEEPDFDDTATLNGRESTSVLPPSGISRPAPRPRSRVPSPTMSLRSWNRAHATSGDLEALFDHMLIHKFGIRKDVNEFILDLLKDVFGHAREVRTMHLALAQHDAESEDGVSGARRETMGLSGSPGLILWPSTFIPMSRSEIEIHASKHLRMLLSCKNFLLEHAVEATDDEEIDEESVLEALWEYEAFLRHRFNPPPLHSSSPYDGLDQDSDVVSIRSSIAESVSSDGREAMWDIQSEFRQRFAWRSGSRSGSTSRSPTPRGNTPKISSMIPSTSFSQTTLTSRPTTAPSPTPTARPDNRDTDLGSQNAAPLYSRDELTRVRTFRIYEAIKIDETVFGSAM